MNSANLNYGSSTVEMYIHHHRVHMSKISWDKAVSDARQVFTKGIKKKKKKSLGRVSSDPRSLAHLRRWVSTL